MSDGRAPPERPCDRPALHLVIYSELRRYGGGRETWLGYFLPGVAASGRFRAIYVHHMRSDEPEGCLPAAWSGGEGDPVRFLASSAVIHGGGSPGGRFARFAAGVLRGLHRHARRGDLVVAVGVHGEAPAALLGQLAGLVARRDLRLVTWVREPSVRQVGARRGRLVHALFRCLERVQLAASRRVVTNGEDTRALYLRLFPWLGPRLVNIPNAVAPDGLERLPLPDWTARPLRVGFLGRLLPEKGFPALVEAARLAAGPELELCAWGHDLEGLRRPAPPPGLRIDPPVSRERLAEVLGTCHVLAFLNDSHLAAGLSHALLEALAAGRPVVAWDAPVHSQVVGAHNGWLVPEGDVEALAGLLRALPGRPPGELAARAASARQTAARYTPAAHVARFLAEVADPLRR